MKIHFLAAAVVVIGAIGLAGCGGGGRGSAGPSHDVASGPAASEPVTIEVRATPVGSSVRLDITGVGRRRPERHAMENPRNWTIAAMVGDRLLDRTVNGSVRVIRHPVGRVDSGLWDIAVTFTVAFAVPADARELSVRIQAPESEPFETTFEVAADPAEGLETPGDAIPAAPRRSR